jgi:hypothetical protein
MLDTVLEIGSMSPYRCVIHARCASCDLATLLHALQLAAAVGLRFAHHVVIVVGLASCANEERGAEKRSRAGSEFLDLGDVIRQRGGVDEDLLRESGFN